MNTPRPPRPGSAPVPRRPVPAAPIPRRPAVQASGASSGKGKWIAVAAGGIVLIVAAVAIFSGKKPPAPEPVVTKPPAPKIVPKAPPPPPPPPAPAPVAAPPPPPKKAPQDPLEALKADMARKAEARRKEGAERLAAARKEIEQDVEREKKESAAFEKRFVGLELDVALTSKQVYRKAQVTGFTADELRLKTPERESLNLPWTLVAPESVSAVAHHVYKAQTADDQLALARFLVDRRLWKEAQAALHRLKKIDEEYERIADDYDEAAGPLLTGKGHFQGSLRVTPPSGLHLAYDFTDDAQAEDFRGPDDGFTIAGGKLTLESKERHLWRIGPDLEFGDEFEFEAKASVTGTLIIGFHARPGSGLYVIETGPAGTVLKKGRDRDLKELASNAKAVLKGDQKIRLTASRGKIAFRIADKPALSFEDASVQGPPVGACLVGVADGKAVLSAPLGVGGQVNPDYMKKKIGTVEMAARRSIDKDLGEVRELNAQQLANRFLGGSDEGISSDGFLIEFIPVQELADYDNLKQLLSGRDFSDDIVTRLEKKFEEWQEKYPGFPSLLYLRGIRHFHRSELVEARDKFTKAVAIFPDFHEAHYQIARTWWWAREFQKALEHAVKAVEIRPDYAPAHVLAAQMRFALDKKASTAADLDFRMAEKLGADPAEMLHERRRVRMTTRGPRDLGCVHEFESPHYLIVTDIGPERARWYASQLEVVRESYLDAFKKWYPGDPRPKPRIAIFNTREAFLTYTELTSTDRRENLLGFFDPSNNELVLFEDLDLDETLQVLYHEAFHHFASAMLKFPPYWWNEGIAEYMSAVRLDPQGKEVKERAMMLEGRLANMKMALQIPFYVQFERIINYTPGEFYSGPVGLHYAQAWTMVHFFYQFEGGKHRPLIERYFEELVRGKTQRQAYEAVFEGKTDELEKEWLKFTKALESSSK